MRAGVMAPGRPTADEGQPYYFQYIDLVPDGHIVALLERQITETAAFLAPLTPEQASGRKAPGEWNVLEMIGHIAPSSAYPRIARSGSRERTR
jgi:hypothetical protein